MVQIRFKGPAVGDDLGTVTVSDETNTGQVRIMSFGRVISALPLIAGSQHDGDTTTVDTSRLANVTSIQWRVQGGANLGTSTTQDLAGLGGSYVECVTVSDEGTLTSPPVFVYSLMMHADHNAVDAALLAMAKHSDCTKVAAQSGDWSNPSTWVGNGVPVSGDRVLVPAAREVVYDADASNVSIESLRVDGALRFATDVGTHLKVRDIVGDRNSAIYIGNSLADRIDPNVQATITFEGQSSLNITTDPELLGRGLVTNGDLYIYGTEKLNHSMAATGLEAGSTSVPLDNPPVGWVVGDQVIIGQTSATLPFGVGSSMADIAEDEIVTITSVVGDTVTFTPALTYDHTNQNPSIERRDIRPMVQLRAQSRNIIIQSEVTAPVTQRGHIMCMHMHSNFDIWDAGLIGLGRTDKGGFVGLKNADDNFEVETRDGREITPFASDDNIRGRYSFHAHLTGYDKGVTPRAVNISIEDNPGWGMTHHDCEFNIESCSTFRVFGCGFVAEQGGELGKWHNLSAMQATAVNDTSDIALAGSPKSQGGQNVILNGDTFKSGYGFGYRGRALQMTNCVATSCSTGHVFHHRTLGDALAPLNFPPRSRMDLKELGLFNGSVIIDTDKWEIGAYPIVHFSGNGAIGCLRGSFVTKQIPQQSHDLNVIWKGFFSWGHRVEGAHVEYVGTYILQDFDCVGGLENTGYGIGQNGIKVGGNTYQIAVVRAQTWGNGNNGIIVDADSLFVTDPATFDAFDSTIEPRYFLVGNESYGDGKAINYKDGGTKTLDQVAVIEDDPDFGYIDFTADPTETFPDTVGIFDGSTGAITTPPTNLTGLKFGNHPVGLPIASKLWNDSPFPQGTFQMARLLRERGFNQLGGHDVLVQRDVISDVLTGRPAKFTALWQADAPVTLFNALDLGPTSFTTAVTGSDILRTVAPGGSVTFNALAGLSGGSGSYEIDPGDFVKPDYGDLTIDYATGDVTYTPTYGVTSQSDWGYVFVRSVQDPGTGTEVETPVYATRRIAFLVTDSDTLNAPVHLTDFRFEPSTDGTSVDLTLLQRPNTGGRRVLGVQYSSDNGTTWLKVCNGWPRATIALATQSDGVTPWAIGSHSIRLRLLTDHEYGFSPETANIPS